MDKMKTPENADTPIVYNVAMTNADTEYSQALPKNTRKVLFKLRGSSAALKYAYESTESGTKYITIPAGGGSKYLEGIFLDLTSPITLYFQSPTASQVLEIEVFVSSVNN